MASAFSVGGHDPVYQLVEEGVLEATLRFQDVIVPPVVVSPSGYAFDGWYWDEAYTRPFSEGSLLYEDGLTLYAKFVSTAKTVYAVRVPVGRAVRSTGDEALYGLPRDFVCWAVEEAVPGKEIEFATGPMLNGLNFDGWYRDPEFQDKTAGEVAKEEGLILYGHYQAAGAGGLYGEGPHGYEMKKYFMIEGAPKDIVLPEMEGGHVIECIPAEAFAMAEGVQSVKLPSGVSYVDPQAFNGADTLQYIYVDDKNLNFKSLNGVLYNKDMTVLYRYPEGKTSGSFVIPNSVLAVAPYAFYGNSYLTNVTVGSSVETIDAHAFEECTKLSKISLPASVTMLGEQAFWNCHSLISFRALALAEIGKDAIPGNIWMLVTGPLLQGALREYCLAEGSGLQKNYNTYYVTVRSGDETILLFGWEAGTPIAEEYLVSETGDGSVRTLYQDSAFTMPWPKDQAMPEQDLTLYANVASPFTTEEITVETTDGEGNPVTLTGVIVTGYTGPGGSVVIPDTIGGQPVIALGENILSDAQGTVTSVTIGAGVVQIAESALDSEDGEPFAGAVYTDEGTKAREWAEGAGYEADDTIYTLSFETNGGAPVESRDGVKGTEVRLPAAEKTGSEFIGWYADAELTEAVVLNSDELYEITGNAALYAAWNEVEPFSIPFAYTISNGKAAITGYTGDGETAEIPAEIHGALVTAIAADAFAYNRKLKTLILPDSVKTIGEDAFHGSAIAHVSFTGVNTIGEGAFEDCVSLAEIELSGVVTIGKEAFRGCAALTSVDLADSVKTVGERVFAYCEALTAVTIGKGLEDLGSSVFKGCSSLASFAVDPGSRVYKVQDGMLLTYGGTVLLAVPAMAEDAYVPDGVIVVADCAMYGQKNLTLLILPASVESIGESAFAECTELVTADLSACGGSLAGRGIEDEFVIPADAFMGDSKLKTVVLSNAITGIESGAFGFCRSLETIEIPASVETIDSLAFMATPSSLTIMGATGSAAQQAARESGCLFVDPDAKQVETVTIQTESNIMRLGESMAVSAEISPADAAGEIDWESGDRSVLVIDDGMVYALKRGTAFVYAVAENGAYDSFEITVTGALADEVRMGSAPADLAAGETFAMTAVILPDTAEDASPVWTVSGDAASIDENGMLTALHEGRATVRASALSGRFDEAEIEIYEPVTDIAIPEGQMGISMLSEDGVNRFALCLQALPENATHRELAFVSSNESVLTVDEDGMITALAPGEANIVISTDWTAGHETIEKTVHVAVIEKDALEPKIGTYCGILTLAKGQKVAVDWTTEFAETATDEEKNAFSVRWVSDDSAVVAVSENGKITAVDTGTAGICLYRSDLTGPMLRMDVEVRESLTEVRLPAALTRIGAGAFAGIAPERITASRALSAIGNCAFGGAPNLKQIQLSFESVEGLTADSFAECGEAVIILPKGDPAISLLRTAGIPYIFEAEKTD